MSHPNGGKNPASGDEPASLPEALERLVQKVTRDPALRQDLMQEALVHLWLIETRRPGQTDSWYLQSCRFRLQHYLASGRSVDSGKRREGKVQFAFDSETGEGAPEQSDSGNTVLTSVSAREIIHLLSRHLKPQEKAVLDCLADGLGAREIGRELKISHTMVIRYRRKIASLLTKLEGPNVLATNTPGKMNGQSAQAGREPHLRVCSRNRHSMNGHNGSDKPGERTELKFTLSKRVSSGTNKRWG